MGVFYWVLFAISATGVIGCLAAVVRVTHFFQRKCNLKAALPFPGVTILVPIKGVEAATATNLIRLVESKLDIPIQFLLAMETEDDPATLICEGLRKKYPDRDIQIILTGDAGDRMGKQHNLSRAIPYARYPVIGSMDADVCPEPDSIAWGLETLADPQVGVAFSLPYYRGKGPAGGVLVALYTNYYFFIYIGAMALRTAPAFTVGSLWYATLETLNQIGGLEQFTRTVADDAAIGRAVSRQGLKNGLIAKPAGIALENLGFWGGFRHVQKWIAMLREEGLASYSLILLTWHCVLWSCLTLVWGMLAGLQPLLPVSLGLLAVSLAVRCTSIFWLNRRVFRAMPGLRFMLQAILYEVLVAPLLFGIGFFKRTLVWKGRKYTVGRNNP